MTSYLDILHVLDARPELRKLNAHHPRNERFFTALAAEPIHSRRYDRSQAFLERANAVIPLAAQTFSKSKVQYPQPSPLFVSHGSGGHVFDVDGNAYVDLVGALLPNVLGYRDPDVDAAIRHQLDAGISFSLATKLETELAETLRRLIPCAEMTRFGKTGSDVTTAAIRLARAVTERTHVVICGGYHGWHDWTTARDLGVPESTRRMTLRQPFGASLDELLDQINVAAVIVEPEMNREYLRHLRNACDKNGALLIFDEMITGFRWHLGGAQSLFGVTPDLACFGKAMANGMPLSALVGKREFMQRLEPPDNIFYSGTFFGEALSLAASIATIAKLERENVIAGLHAKADRLRGEIRNMIVNADLYKVIGVADGPLSRLTFHAYKGWSADQIRALFMREMIGAGVLMIASHNLCHAHDDNDLERVLKAYDWTLHVMVEALDHGNVAERLGNTHIPTGAGVRSA